MTPIAADLEPRAVRLRRMRRRLAMYAALAAGAVAVSLLDTPVYRVLHHPESEVNDWYQALRQVGSILPWLAAGGMLWAIDLDRRTRGRSLGGNPWHHRGGLLMLAAVGSGVWAELLKLVLARERPLPPLGYHVYRVPLSGFLDGSNLGLPSSHTAVAFGGAVMVGLMCRPLKWVMLGIAGGCALTRLLAGAHFLSDVYLGVITAALWATWLWRRGQGDRRGPAGGLAHEW